MTVRRRRERPTRSASWAGFCLRGAVLTTSQRRPLPWWPASAGQLPSKLSFQARCGRSPGAARHTANPMRRQASGDTKWPAMRRRGAARGAAGGTLQWLLPLVDASAVLRDEARVPKVQAIPGGRGDGRDRVEAGGCVGNAERKCEQPDGLWGLKGRDGRRCRRRRQFSHAPRPGPGLAGGEYKRVVLPVR